jgi:hypothetical protein
MHTRAYTLSCPSSLRYRPLAFVYYVTLARHYKQLHFVSAAADTSDLLGCDALSLAKYYRRFKESLCLPGHTK